MKNAFCLSLKPFLFVEKRLDQKAVVSFNIYDVKDLEIDNYNTHIAQYLKK